MQVPVGLVQSLYIYRGGLVWLSDTWKAGLVASSCMVGQVTGTLEGWLSYKVCARLVELPVPVPEWFSQCGLNDWMYRCKLYDSELLCTWFLSSAQTDGEDVGSVTVLIVDQTEESVSVIVMTFVILLRADHFKFDIVGVIFIVSVAAWMSNSAHWLSHRLLIDILDHLKSVVLLVPIIIPYQQVRLVLNQGFSWINRGPGISGCKDEDWCGWMGMWVGMWMGLWVCGWVCGYVGFVCGYVGWVCG